MYRFLGVGRAHSTMQTGVGKEIDPIGVPIVTVRWTIGPRIPEWTELWRRILVEVLPNNEDVTNDAEQALPTESLEVDKDG
jgi:hypothetical protein